MNDKLYVKPENYTQLSIFVNKAIYILLFKKVKKA